MAKARATKDLRRWAYHAAVAAINESMDGKPLWKRATVQLRIVYDRPGHAIAADGDNWIARMKAAFDGLQDAGIVANDAGLIHLPPIITAEKGRKRVEIEIWEA